MILDPNGDFRRNYNRRSFMFSHELAGNPLFDLSNLKELARRLAGDRDTYWSNGGVKVSNDWTEGTQNRLSLQDTIDGIEHNNSIVILKHTEQDPVYAPVLQKTLAAMIECAGEAMRDDVTIGEVLILVSSPNRITPYHMDAEVNFLLQIRGDKNFYVFDQNDRELVTDRELEAFYAVSANIANYRPEWQSKANSYDLRAGSGVHIPVTAPHWVQNSNNVSVALSVNYELKSTERLLKLHRFNHKLRKLGVVPTPPRRSAWRDEIKLAAASGIGAVRSLTRREPARGYEVWKPQP